MRHRLMDARVVEVAGGDVVGFGSTVEVEDEATGKRMTYTLVAVHEASAADGRLSAESPVAAALDRPAHRRAVGAVSDGAEVLSLFEWVAIAWSSEYWCAAVEKWLMEVGVFVSQGNAAGPQVLVCALPRTVVRRWRRVE